MPGYTQLASAQMMQGNLVAGPNGTREVDYFSGFAARLELLSGWLAESWEFPDDETIIYHLNKGVRYHDKPPVNGRELIADDVVWWLDTCFNTPKLYFNTLYPPGSGMAPTSFKALDKYTVEVKVPAALQGMLFLEMGAGHAYIYPPEIWTEYGGVGDDWEKVISLGPFILSDYIVDSVATYERNPNYFEFDPTLPENRLPYAGKLRELIIMDASSRLAAFRTGRIDYMRMLTLDDAQLLLKQCPDMESAKFIDPVFNPNTVAGRIDAPPFDDIRVRQAMNLAVNQQEILDEYFSGDGELYEWPYPSIKSFQPFHTPPEELPEEVTMLYTYNPDKARQLLADAGYPEGFKTRCIASNIPTTIDYLSLIKAYLADVNIDMEIVPLEAGAFTGYYFGRNQKAGEMLCTTAIVAPDTPLALNPIVPFNYAFIDDPYYDRVFEAQGREIVFNPNYWAQIIKEMNVYQLASAWGIWNPMPYTYNLWWPWVKEYYGMSLIAWARTHEFIKMIWVDQALKKSMGY
jgi:peptide/nickel transport system substrate-binding protein